MQVTSSCSIQYRFIKTTGSGLQEGARFIVHKTNEITFPWYCWRINRCQVYELPILGACASQGIPDKSNNCLVLFLATFKVTNASQGEGTEGEAPKSKACNFPALPQRHFSAGAAAPGCHGARLGSRNIHRKPSQDGNSCLSHGTDHHLGHSAGRDTGHSSGLATHQSCLLSQHSSCHSKC